jgi:hypothetical protein
MGKQGKGNAAVSQHDREMNMLDDGAGLLSGAVLAPHFGHGYGAFLSLADSPLSN